MNINLLNDNNNITCYKNQLLSQGVTQLVKLPTRLSKKSKTLIDHIYTNLPEEQTKTDNLIYDISDHIPIITFLTPYHSSKPNIQRKLIRDFRNFNQTQFLNELEENLTPINSLKRRLKPNDLWNEFENILNNTFDKHAPFKLQTRKELKRHFSPWLTKDLLFSIKDKQKLYKRAIKNPSTSNWNKFRSHRNKVNKLIFKAKQNYYKTEIFNAKSNSKKKPGK